MSESGARRLLPLWLTVSVSASVLATWAFSRKHPSGADGATGVFETWVRAWSTWDGAWYARIAAEGYSYTPGQQSPVAFFPGYPLAVRALSQLGLSIPLTGMLLTWGCGVLALLVFLRWARCLVPGATADLAAVLVLVYPFSFYLYGAVYSDAFFLLLAASSFWMLERGKVGSATLLGVLATASRPIAPALVLGLTLRSLERRRQSGLPLRVRDFLPVLSGLGLALYMLFLWHRFGDPLAFAHVQGAPGWDQAPGPKTWFKLAYLHAFSENPRLALRLSLHAGVTLVGLGLAGFLFRRVSRAYGVYAVMALGIPALSSKDFQGLGRYALAAFPCFVALALLLEPRPKWRRLYLAGTVLLLAVLTYLFGAGEYVS